jgi:hypothetical protein
VRRALSLIVAATASGWLLTGLAMASGIPAALARSRALDDYAGVALLTFVSIVVLLPIGFVLASIAHLTWPEPGRRRGLLLGICGISLGLVEAGWIAVNLWNQAQIESGIVTALASGAAVLAAAALDLRLDARRRQTPAS